MNKTTKYAGTQTEKNLMAAFAGESEARNKYTYFASKAKKDGFEQIAALFLKTAENEKEHAKLWFKELGGIDHDLDLISPESIAPIQELKVRYLGSTNPRLHTDEVLIALSTCAATDQNARTALEQLPKLRGCQVHTSVLLSDVDTNIFKKLGIELTCEPVQEDKK